MYKIIKEIYPKSFYKGQDLFDANLFKDPVSVDIFFRFIAHLKEKVNACKVTATHNFINLLSQNNKLLRCYTQNIDNLEEQFGLNAKDNLVQLHGSLSLVRCTLCSFETNFNDKLINTFKKGGSIHCPDCIIKDDKRVLEGKRAILKGILRPNIVLYNEHHPKEEFIGDLQLKDIRKNPDLLIIMGTSLKIIGIKKLIKVLGKTVHNFKNGKVIFINLTKCESNFNNIIDYHFQMDTDYFVNNLMDKLGWDKTPILYKQPIIDHNFKLEMSPMKRSNSSPPTISK